jgi:hypothetical protein
MAFDFSTLITDRTLDDVMTGTDKGYYNATDLNRVGEAVESIAGRFTGYGYAVEVSPKADWSKSDTPTASRYRKDIHCTFPPAAFLRCPW